MARARTPTLSSLGRSPSRIAPVKPATPTPPPPSQFPAKDPAPEGNAVGRWLRGALFENVGLKFLSLVLAITVFLLVNTDRDREIHTSVGVRYAIPEDKVLVSDQLTTIDVTIKGSARKLRGFDQREVEQIVLDANRASATGEIPINPAMIQLPSGLTVVEVNPRFARVQFESKLEKIVEVIPAITGRPAHGYVVAEVKPSPATVRVRGAESVLRTLTAVKTRDVAVDGKSTKLEVDTEVVLPPGLQVAVSAPIEVAIYFDEELVSRKVGNLTIVPKGPDGIALDPAKWVITPPQVDVTLTGALLAVEKAKDAMTPVIKLPAGTAPRESVDIVLEGLPPGVGSKLSQERVKIVPAAR